MPARDAFEQEQQTAKGVVERWHKEQAVPLPPEKTRQTRRWPHEEGRAGRQTSVTFPTPAWREYIGRKAAALGIRPSDLLVYCLAYAFAALESGELLDPDTSRFQRHHRAGKTLNLSWEPPDEF